MLFFSRVAFVAVLTLAQDMPGPDETFYSGPRGPSHPLPDPGLCVRVRTASPTPPPPPPPRFPRHLSK